MILPNWVRSFESKTGMQERKLFSIANISVKGFRQIHSGDYDETLTQVTLLYSIKDIW